MRFIPTSITVAPALTISGETRPATPTAATRTSASSVCRSSSIVREWQIVTVAFAWRSRCATGLPTIALRPITTARADEGHARRGEELHDPERRRGDVTRSAEVEEAGVDRVEAVDVLRGSTAEMTRASSMWSGSGSWTRIPSTSSSAFSRVDELEQLLLARVGGEAQVLRLDADLRPAALCFRRM